MKEAGRELKVSSEKITDSLSFELQKLLSVSKLVRILPGVHL